MKTIFLALAVASVATATPASSAGKLSYLSAYDIEAIGYFKCAASVEAVRQVLLKDGYDTYSSVPATFDKAGRAAVIKAALLAEEFERRPKVKKISFTSDKANRLVSGDIAAHRAAALDELAQSTLPDGFDTVAGCTMPDRLDAARAMVDWFDNDVALFESLK